MGINYKRRFLIKEQIVNSCNTCKKVFEEDYKFCPTCGNKLTSQKTKIYANVGKTGITSYSYKLPNGTTINSKGNITVPVSTGISFTMPNK